MSYTDNQGNILDNKGMNTGMKIDQTGQILDMRNGGVAKGYRVNNTGSLTNNMGMNVGASFNNMGQLVNNKGMNDSIDNFIPQNNMMDNLNIKKMDNYRTDMYRHDDYSRKSYFKDPIDKTDIQFKKPEPLNLKQDAYKDDLLNKSYNSYGLGNNNLYDFNKPKPLDFKKDSFMDLNKPLMNDYKNNLWNKKF
ncbi:MAG: hypothetical protein ACOCWW_00455 [Bacteroidota bacterium]